MSTILNGAIEIYDEYSESWHFVMDTFQIFYQDYNIFAILFGVRNYLNFDPVAPNRNLPNDISKTTKHKFNIKDESDSTYITLEELERIPETLKSKKLISVECNQFGELIKDGVIHNDIIKFDENEIHYQSNDVEIWKRDKKYYTNTNISAKHILKSNIEFNLLFRILKLLNEKHKMENIRWIVSFIN